MSKLIYLLLNLIIIAVFNRVAFYKCFNVCYNAYMPIIFRRGGTVNKVKRILIWIFNHLDLVKTTIQLINTLMDFIDLMR